MKYHHLLAFSPRRILGFVFVVPTKPTVEEMLGGEIRLQIIHTGAGSLFRHVIFLDCI